MEEGSEPAGTGLSAFCQGKVAAGRGAEGLWQGLVLMAGTHRVLRLGTEPQQHTGEPRGEFCCTRRVTGEGAPGTGGGRATPPPPAGTGDPAGTYNSRSSQQRAVGMGQEGRESPGRERRHSYCSGGAAVPP